MRNMVYGLSVGAPDLFSNSLRPIDG